MLQENLGEGWNIFTKPDMFLQVDLKSFFDAIEFLSTISYFLAGIMDSVCTVFRVCGDCGRCHKVIPFFSELHNFVCQKTGCQWPARKVIRWYVHHMPLRKEGGITRLPLSTCQMVLLHVWAGLRNWVTCKLLLVMTNLVTRGEVGKEPGNITLSVSDNMLWTSK